MKNITLLGLVATALLVGSCNNEELVEKTAEGNVVLHATINDTDSRAALTDEGIFSWTKGDQISVYTTEHTFSIFTLKASDAGNATGTFTGGFGVGASMSTCAVYPYNKNHSLTGKQLTFHMADSYAYVEGNTNAPMIAKISDGNANLGFTHLGGVIRFILKDIPAGVDKLVFSTSSKISGDFIVSDVTATTPSIVTSASDDQDVINAEKSVAITFPTTTEKSNKTFYIPVPTGTYTSMKLELKGNDEVLQTLSTDKSNTVNRTTLLRMPVIVCAETTGGVIASVSTNVNDLNSLLSNSVADASKAVNSVVLSGDVVKKLDTPITIPTAYTESTGGKTSELNFSFDEVPSATDTSSPIEIKDANTIPTTASESKVEVKIAIPKVEEGDKAPSFKITLPTATVTLATTGESTTYNEVESSTAKNTLIIDHGVTVKKLIVKGGNVRIRGTVENIDKTASSSSIIYYDVTSQADVAGYNDSDSKIDKLFIADGANVDFTAHKAITKEIVLGGSATIANAEITTTKEALIATKDNTSLTLKGCKITSTASTGSYGAVKATGKNVNITLENVDVSSSGSAVFTKGNGAVVNITGGTYTSTDYYTIYHNGSYAPVTYNITNATIKNTYKPQNDDEAGVGIYISNSVSKGVLQTLTVTGGTVEADTPIEVKHTTATLKNVALNATAKAQAFMPNGNGACSKGYCFATTKNTSEAAATGECKLTGCTFTLAATGGDLVYNDGNEDLTCYVNTESIAIAAINSKYLKKVVFNSNFRINSPATVGYWEIPAGKIITTLSPNIDIEIRGGIKPKGDLVMKNIKITTTDQNAVYVEQPNTTVNLHSCTLTGTLSSADAVSAVRVEGATDAKVTIYDCKLRTNDVAVYFKSTGLTVEMENSTVAGNYFGVYQHGTVVAKKINITNCNISDTYSEGIGIYISNSLTENKQNFTLTGGSVSGATAIEVKHTNVSVSNCTLTATCATQSYSANGSGSCTTGYCFARTLNAKDQVSTGTTALTGCTYNVTCVDGKPLYGVD